MGLKTAIHLLYPMKGKKASKKEWDSLEEPQRTYTKIGAHLKALRIKKGFTSADKFAFTHDIDRSQYGKYERGRDMQISTLLRLLIIHNMTIEEFFGKMS